MEGPKIGVELSASNETKSHLCRVKSKGAVRVASRQSSDTGLVITPSKDDKAYFSVWTKVGGNDFMIAENVRVRTEDDIRLCVWLEGG
jgi:hypothetical protein